MVTPHRFEISLPIQLAPKFADLRLLTQPKQCSKGLIHNLAFGFQACSAQRFAHEFVVDDYVRPHRCVSLYQIIHTQCLTRSRGLEFEFQVESFSRS